MRYLLTVLLVLFAVAVAEDFNRHSITVSAGIPGLLLPELSYEFGFDKANKLGIAAGSFFLWPEYRMSYVRMINRFELTGSLGFVPHADNDDDDGFLSDVFDDFFSGGTEGAKFVSATAGYRYTADCGFIFRAAAGGGYFFNSDDSRTLPFLQLGVGYGF